MLAKVKSWIAKQRLLEKGDRVVLACSGGPDSLALVHIMSALRHEWCLELVVAHVDHMFRGEESAKDADFVEDFCGEHNLTCYRTAIDVPAYIKATGHSSTEDAARTLRYRYLRAIAADLGGAKIATGHHRDDQAETVLLHLLRGAGGAGLRGILPINDGIIRPLLTLSRREIEEYCARQQLDPRTDSSNLHMDYLRNRIRLELLPFIEGGYSPCIRENLARTARIIGEQYDYVRTEAIRVWPEIVQESDGDIIINSQHLSQQHQAVKSELIRLVIEKKLGGLRGITFLHVEKLLMAVSSGTVGNIVELPDGLYGEKTYDGLRLTNRSAPRTCAQVAPPGKKLSVPGSTLVAELGLTVITAFTEHRLEAKARQSISVDWEQLVPPLYVRTRVAGDKFKPQGLGGTKKLKDYLIDAKVPRSERDGIPLICDEQGIIWVAGYRQSERGRINAATKQILQITIDKQEAN